MVPGSVMVKKTALMEVMKSFVAQLIHQQQKVWCNIDSSPLMSRCFNFTFHCTHEYM